MAAETLGAPRRLEEPIGQPNTTQAVGPALSPSANHTSYAFLVNKAALLFRRSLTENQVFAIKNEIYELENGSGFSTW